MQAIIEETEIIQKTRDLCQTLVEQSEFQQIRRSIDAFMADDEARNQYQLVMEKGDQLQHKQHSGQPLDNAEIAEFEKNREILLNNTLARDFLEAQQQMHKIQESVMQFVGKTFELGRVPTTEDLSSGGCGSSCGCGH
jgi:cell fate (sporulation/competence/biofilm development) regulator YlbF (YheA/YmcA/DUF963 family)